MDKLNKLEENVCKEMETISRELEEISSDITEVQRHLFEITFNHCLKDLRVSEENEFLSEDSKAKSVFLRVWDFCFMSVDLINSFAYVSAIIWKTLKMFEPFDCF